MNISDYVFNVGDEVITVDGERGRITTICDCRLCKERGFFEPCWKDEDGDPRDITVYEAEAGFPSYYKIGDYQFNPFNKNGVKRQIAEIQEYLDVLRNRLAFMEELEKEET